MIRRHADIWSHSGHYLVDLGHQMVMVMNDLPTPLFNVNQSSHSEIQLFQNLTMTILGQRHPCGQRSRSHFTKKIQRSRSNPMATFDAQSSIDMFAFRFVAIGQFLAEIQQIPYVTLKMQGQGHGQGETRWSHLMPRVQSVCLFAFHLMTIGPFLAEI